MMGGIAGVASVAKRHGVYYCFPWRCTFSSVLLACAGAGRFGS